MKLEGKKILKVLSFLCKPGQVVGGMDGLNCTLSNAKDMRKQTEPLINVPRALIRYSNGYKLHDSMMIRCRLVVSKHALLTPNAVAVPKNL